ncbi:M42 family metallopeptidase [Alkaliphilus oremlandii]|uniref:Peptidase M42 family protein n=1 Tax=Alkaliphilus oremlandii (strain OhILAs) TaxID=350688 RepID=A8MFD8_ALKOO|nr:M42 family metallopeptidase [Alkaliphilus oremlandii]ABW19101.1 peptidase M42 family protein [Alkaliphilus oremlandii OhILAs]
MLLKRLTDAMGVSGDEKEVRDLILSEIKEHVDRLKIDTMGNIIAYKKGIKGDTTIAVTAHMDEVGFIIKGIDGDGLIKFAAIGGIDARILVSKQVLVGKNKINGVIGAKAIHLQRPDERKRALSIDDLYIDIGCTSKTEAEKLVHVGDYIGFYSEYVAFGKNRIKAKALDNRVACSILIELLQSDVDMDIIGVFTVQEEIGLRGAEVAANQIDADLVIVLEGTTCSDVSNVEPHMQVTALDKGPAISLMDRSSVYNRKFVDMVVETAKDANIPWQYRRSTFGGNDAGKFHTAKSGTPCVSIAVPCRYIHSPVSVLSKDDYENCKKLLFTFIDRIRERGLQ